jgi:AraC-like DNA-binding protein
MVESAVTSPRPVSVSRPAPVAVAAPVRVNNYRLQRLQRLAGSFESTLNGDVPDSLVDSTAWNLGEMVVVRETCPARRIERNAQMTRADQMDHYQILVSFSGAGLSVDAEGCQLQAGCGVPVVLDLARPVVATIGAGTSVQAFVPREMLEELLPGPRDLHATKLVGASATVLAEHLRSLTTCLPEMIAAQAPHAVTATMYMVAAALASTPEAPQRARPQIESPVLRQACRFIELHLGEPGLSAVDICGAVKVSRASLYRMFEAYGGVSNHIRERRLARIHAVLAEGRGRRSLARIAEDHGFESSAHFSRAFRQQYGYCPRDAAANSAAACASCGRTVVGAVDSAADPLAQWLRALRG